MTSTGSRTIAAGWDDLWAGSIGPWLTDTGLPIVMTVIAAILATRLIRWAAGRIGRRLTLGATAAGTPHSEMVKHRQTLAAVISSILITVLYVVVAVRVAAKLGFSVGTLVAPAAVAGAALGFGAQRVVQDLLAGFFVITEKHYGFGDLVRLTVTGSTAESTGTVVDVTLRVTTLRNSEGEVVTVPNGQIVKSINLSKDWARAVIDIPVPTGADLNVVNDVLHGVAGTAMRNQGTADLLLDAPTVIGVESISVDAINVRMVARTLPGKQFDVGRQLRGLVQRALRQAGIVAPAGSTATVQTLAADVNRPPDGERAQNQP